MTSCEEVTWLTSPLIVTNWVADIILTTVVSALAIHGAVRAHSSTVSVVGETFRTVTAVAVTGATPCRDWGYHCLDSLDRRESDQQGPGRCGIRLAIAG